MKLDKLLKKISCYLRINRKVYKVNNIEYNMENKEHQKKIMNLLKKDKNEHGLCLSDIKRRLSLTKDQIRMSVSFLLGAKKVQELRYGRSKIYLLPSNNFLGDED